MKGFFFTELLNMVEVQFGYELVDSLLLTTDLPSGGSYTAAGFYPSQEMTLLIGNLSQRLNQSVPDVLRLFGRHLFQSFLLHYQPFIHVAPDAFSFLESVNDYIHVEVKKLYPEVEMPQFTTTRLNEQRLLMIYQSKRKMADLAYGLIEGVLAHYGEQAVIHQRSLEADGSHVEFLIVRERES
ncbi:heme NO-binding domain-containing protein [Spirosoma aerophilum]